LKKFRLYLDTSVLNFALSDRPGDELFKIETVKFINKIKLGVYECYISGLVITEIGRAPEPKKNALLNFVNELNLERLLIDEEIEDLASKYIKEGLIPKKHEEDAVHIAVASINNLDAIVSWNFEHMIKLKTKRGVVAVNELMGYKTIEIITPQEVD
jgi:hypothetical protein